MIFPSNCKSLLLSLIQDSLSVPGVTNPFGMGYLFNPYAAYANGAAQLVSRAKILYIVIADTTPDFVCGNESKYQCSNQSQLGHFFQIYQIILFLWWDKTWLESFCSNLWKNFSNLMQIPKWYLKQDKPELIQTFLFYSSSLETIKQ